MKVILLRDVPNTGRKNEIKEVSPGFARNFLISKGLAVLADEQSLKTLEARKKVDAIRAEEETKETKSLIEKLKKEKITIEMKVGEEGQLFESVSKQKIAEKLKEAGYGVDKDDVVLESPIKELGEFSIKLRLAHGLEGEAKIIIKGSEEK